VLTVGGRAAMTPRNRQGKSAFDLIGDKIVARERISAMDENIESTDPKKTADSETQSSNPISYEQFDKLLRNNLRRELEMSHNAPRIKQIQTRARLIKDLETRKN
jgi:hypothetical protein